MPAEEAVAASRFSGFLYSLLDRVGVASAEQGGAVAVIESKLPGEGEVENGAERRDGREEREMGMEGNVDEEMERDIVEERRGQGAWESDAVAMTDVAERDAGAVSIFGEGRGRDRDERAAEAEMEMENGGIVVRGQMGGLKGKCLLFLRSR